MSVFYNSKQGIKETRLVSVNLRPVPFDTLILRLLLNDIHDDVQYYYKINYNDKPPSNNIPLEPM